MNQNKSAILSAISKGNPLAGDQQAKDIESAASHMLDSIADLQPSLPIEDTVESFRQRISSNKIAATIESIDQIDDLPTAIAGYLAKQGLDADIVIQPCDRLVSLDWKGIRIRHQAGSDEPLAVTLGQLGIAETGSIVISSGSDSPVLLNFLASHHILVIEEKNIVASLEDCAPRINSLSDYRTVCLITGASGTTDIEGILVNGAHGPEHLHVITIR